ncbi:hypothetical protein HKW97_13385 [Pseudomonas luteola]|uniref:hypothetical protein n=1 Tax=Pseudomonas luteola TaxID=47886 RepID=UPI0038903F95
MSSLLRILKGESKEMAVATSQSQEAIEKLASISLGSDKGRVFAEEVTSVVKSKDFQKELSEVIDRPYPDETEEEFVNRAKREMRELLKKKFNK